MLYLKRCAAENRKAFCPKRSYPLFIMLIIISALMLLSALLSVLIIKRYINMVNDDTNQLLYLAADSYTDVVQTRLNNYTTGMELIALNQTIRDNIFRTDVTRTEMVGLGNTLKKTIDSLTYFFYQSGELYQHKIYTHLPGNGAYFSSLDSIQNTWCTGKCRRTTFPSCIGIPIQWLPVPVS